MGFQFVHMESFSRKGDGKGRTTGFVFSEARRDPAASVHVAKPSPPTVVYGLDVAEVGPSNPAGFPHVFAVGFQSGVYFR